MVLVVPSLALKHIKSRVDFTGTKKTNNPVTFKASKVLILSTNRFKQYRPMESV